MRTAFFLPSLCRRAEKTAPGIPSGQRKAEMPKCKVSQEDVGLGLGDL